MEDAHTCQQVYATKLASTQTVCENKIFTCHHRAQELIAASFITARGERRAKPTPPLVSATLYCLFQVVGGDVRFSVSTPFWTDLINVIVSYQTSKRPRLIGFILAQVLTLTVSIRKLVSQQLLMITEILLNRQLAERRMGIYFNVDLRSSHLICEQKLGQRFFSDLLFPVEAIQKP